MAKVRRVELFRRRVVETLSPAGVEALLSVASVLSEGQLAPDGRFYGSTMITVELADLARHVADRGFGAPPARTAKRLAEALASEQPLLDRLAERARQEARTVAAKPLADLEADVRLDTRDGALLIDIDVEGWAERKAQQSS